MEEDEKAPEEKAKPYKRRVDCFKVSRNLKKEQMATIKHPFTYPPEVIHKLGFSLTELAFIEALHDLGGEGHRIQVIAKLAERDPPLILSDYRMVNVINQMRKGGKLQAPNTTDPRKRGVLQLPEHWLELYDDDNYAS